MIDSYHDLTYLIKKTERRHHMWDKFRIRALFSDLWWQRKYLVVTTGLSSIAIMIIELMYRKNLVKTFGWLLSHPFLFLLNLSMVLLGIGVIQVISNKKTLGPLLVLPSSLLLGALNAGKYSLRNVPVTMDDFRLIKEVWALKEELVTLKSLGMVSILVIVITGIGFGLYHILKRYDAKRIRQVGFIYITLSFLIIGVGQIVNDSELSMEKSGFLYSISSPTRVKPVATVAIIQSLDEKIEASINTYTPVETKLETGQQPNVVIIMSEAFWDINKMGLDLEENPVPYFESLRDESIYGELYVPVFGGGTVNTEFEVMTGMTVKNLAYDYLMAYTNVIDSPMPSLASIYRAQGYKSIAVHPYMSWYYQRYEVYKYFGFDDFYSLEFMGDTEKFGNFTKDDVPFNQVLDLLEETEEPVFNYTVTMQNHGPYGDARFTEEERTMPLVTSMGDAANYFVNNYIQGLYYSDLALERFIESLRELDEPTMVVFFGDHLPFLGDDYLAYRESGYIGDEGTDDLMEDLKMMSVPYIVWRNYDDSSVETEVMNASYLTPKILEWSGAQVPDYLKVVSSMSDVLPIMMREFGYTNADEQVDKTSEIYQETRAIYQKLYENLFVSDMYLDEEEWTLSDNTTYNGDINTLTITDVETQDNHVLLFGSDFSQEMELYINDILYDYDYVSEEEVVVNTTLDQEVELQLVLKDQEGTTTAVSNIFKWLPQ